MLKHASVKGGNCHVITTSLLLSVERCTATRSSINVSLLLRKENEKKLSCWYREYCKKPPGGEREEMKRVCSGYRETQRRNFTVYVLF